MNIARNEEAEREGSAIEKEDIERIELRIMRKLIYSDRAVAKRVHIYMHACMRFNQRSIELYIYRAEC